MYIPFEEKDWDIQIGRSGFQQLTFIGEKNELYQQFDESFKEVNKLIEFYQYSLHQGKNEISKILLTGDHPLLDDIMKELQTRFEIKVEILDAEELQTDKNKPLPRSHYLAFGLALKEV